MVGRIVDISNISYNLQYNVDEDRHVFDHKSMDC